MKMRQSKVLRKLRAGEVVSCFKINLNENSTDLASRIGFDCLWIDSEHLAQNWTTYQAHILAGKSNNVDTIFRVPRGSYSDFIKPLELDATGLMIPHIMGLEDAKKVVQQTRFYPIGKRPVDGGFADGAYSMMNFDFKEYIKQANENRFIVLQIEDPEPLDELEDIAALDGVDMLFFGPADFSHAIGNPGDWNHPIVLEARKRVAEAAVKHGKFAGIPATIENMDEMIDLGYRFLNIGADVLGLTKYCQHLVESFSKKINQ